MQAPCLGTAERQTGLSKVLVETKGTTKDTSGKSVPPMADYVNNGRRTRGGSGPSVKLAWGGALRLLRVTASVVHTFAIIHHVLLPVEPTVAVHSLLPRTFVPWLRRTTSSTAALRECGPCSILLDEFDCSGLGALRIGMALTDSLDELITSGAITPQLAMKVLQQVRRERLVLRQYCVLTDRHNACLCVFPVLNWTMLGV